MKFLTKLSVILLVTMSLQSVNAQKSNEEAEDKLSLNSGNIDSQFEYVFKKSGNFKGTDGQRYEAVKFSSLLTLKNNVLDSLKTTYSKLESSEKVVENQANEIEELKTKLANTLSSLEQTDSEKNNMALLGMQTSKTNYNVIMWSIIAGLLAFLLFFIYKFKGSNSATRDAKHKLDEVETEFEEHRRNALEREQKVRRQLQDELNKQKA
ncbi:tRNA (guanine-N1)-methyltransferase [Winogradskyella psychrotolerans]|uniref:tRNA (guanine-N1)-methyltransferase n=1 Tax=Winogradskyella psychrotolerans TaxID=1344585 RepID=UPI001C0696C1|nr:tRNA (guanine-N1)-methyltransferase [Winogradskyella psychrotolerans]MBU2920401.1 tRNA (guanine-N1)-methyltransferase [Winogradskyella psychrotolerans]